MTDLITAIVPVYKVEKYLDQCIESIVNQSYKNLEIILIDDGSTSDASALICEYWLSQNSRIKVIHKPNGGLSSARNAGLDICTGAYITYIDSDDWVGEDFILNMYKTLIDNKADVCSANMTEYYEKNGNTRIICKREFTANSEETLMKLYNKWEFPVGSAPKMYSSKVWRDLRFPNGRLYEDAFTTYLAVDAADRITHTSDASYYYRVRPGSIMTSKFSLRHIDISRAWKANYIFCKEKYPKVAPYARIAWLEHIPPLIREFPKEMSHEEKLAKKELKKELWDNIWFIIFRVPIKKKYYQLKALFL